MEGSLGVRHSTSAFRRGGFVFLPMIPSQRAGGSSRCHERKGLNDRLIDWSIDWFSWLVDWLMVDWLMVDGWLVDWLIDSDESADWLIALIGWLIALLVGWCLIRLVGCLIDWLIALVELVDWFVGFRWDWLVDVRLVDWLVDSVGSVDRFVDWLIDQLVGWLINRLVGWLVDPSFDWLIELIDKFDWLIRHSIITPTASRPAHQMVADPALFVAGREIESWKTKLRSCWLWTLGWQCFMILNSWIWHQVGWA